MSYMKIPNAQLCQTFERYIHKISFNNRIILINGKDIVSSQKKVWASKKVDVQGSTNTVYLSTEDHRVSMKDRKKRKLFCS